MKAIVWSNVGCSYCEQAKKLLDSKGIDYEERNIAKGPWTVQQLQEAVPGARTVPQIFVDEKHIGGYQELVEHLNHSLQMIQSLLSYLKRMQMQLFSLHYIGM